MNAQGHRRGACGATCQQLVLRINDQVPGIVLEVQQETHSHTTATGHCGGAKIPKAQWSQHRTQAFCKTKQNTNNAAGLLVITARKQPAQKSERGAETKEDMQGHQNKEWEGPGGEI